MPIARLIYDNEAKIIGIDGIQLFDDEKEESCLPVTVSYNFFLGNVS